MLKNKHISKFIVQQVNNPNTLWWQTAYNEKKNINIIESVRDDMRQQQQLRQP